MSRTQMTPTAARSRLARSTVAKATIGLMLLGLCAPQAHAKRVYEFTPNSSPGAGDWSFTCKKVKQAPLADNDAQLTVTIGTDAAPDEVEIWMGLEQFTYDDGMTKTASASLYSEDPQEQFLVFTAAPQPSPLVGEQVAIDLEIYAPDNSVKAIKVADTADVTSDEPVEAAFILVDGGGTSADANVNVSGGTTNEVVHSCSTVSAPVGMGAIAGLMALGLVRRRRES